MTPHVDVKGPCPDCSDSVEHYLVKGRCIVHERRRVANLVRNAPSAVEEAAAEDELFYLDDLIERTIR